MPIQVGDQIPNVTLQYLADDHLDSIETGAYFSDKMAVLFAVPGAFTPTCSAKHLPGFVASVDTFKAKGVDEVICTSVNDPFVMKAWSKQNGADGKVTMLPDGNGLLTAALGLEMDGSHAGLGTRSQRFAMVINNGEVKELLVEEPGQFEVSSAEYVLGKL
jgi:peroxiredoxin